MHGKNPTRAQKDLLKQHRLGINNWLIIKEFTDKRDNIRKLRVKNRKSLLTRDILL